MAQSFAPQSGTVDQFMDMSLDFVRQAAEYAKGDFDPEIDAEIRKLRVAAGALQSALQAVGVVRAPVVPPPPITPVPANVPPPPQPPQAVPPPPAPEPSPVGPTGRRS